MQLDAHVTMVKDWDTIIVEQWRATSNEMAVVSTYLTDLQGSLDADGRSKRSTRPIMCNTAFEGGSIRYLRHNSQPEERSPIRDMPQLQPFWAAGFSFARGHFVTAVKYGAWVGWLRPAQPCLTPLPLPPARRPAPADALHGRGDQHRGTGVDPRVRPLRAAGLGHVPRVRERLLPRSTTAGRNTNHYYGGCVAFCCSYYSYSYHSLTHSPRLAGTRRSPTAERSCPSTGTGTAASRGT